MSTTKYSLYILFFVIIVSAMIIFLILCSKSIGAKISPINKKLCCKIPKEQTFTPRVTIQQEKIFN